MKRIFNICLLLAFLPGYLEWGKDRHAFIFQMETEIFIKGSNDLKSILHPLILLPFTGQLLILITIFQKRVSRILSLVGLACLSLLMLLLMVIGLLTLNVQVIVSTIPFIASAVFVIKYNRKKTEDIGHI
jgi:hypothetical protein